jgi:hypothetical protein
MRRKVPLLRQAASFEGVEKANPEKSLRLTTEDTEKHGDHGEDLNPTVEHPLY